MIEKTKQNQTKEFSLLLMGNLVVFLVSFIEIIIISHSWEKSEGGSVCNPYCRTYFISSNKGGWLGKFYRVQKKADLSKAFSLNN